MCNVTLYLYSRDHQVMGSGPKLAGKFIQFSPQTLKLLQNLIINIRFIKLSQHMIKSDLLNYGLRWFELLFSSVILNLDCENINLFFT